MNTRTMKMEFLGVFCAVLYLHYGDCLHPHHNDPGILYQNEGNPEFNAHGNYETPSNLAYNFNKKLSEIKQHEFERLSQANEPHMRQNEGIEVITPRYVNSQSFPRNSEHFDYRNKRLLRAQEAFPKNVNAQPIGHIENPFIRPHKIKQNVRTESTNEFPKLHAIIKDNDPLKSDEPITLELQGASPEYIESLTGAQTPLSHKHQPPSQPTPTFDDENLKYLRPQSNYKNYPSVNTATFQNPSAESVYKLKHALPYKINNQQFSNRPQNNNLNNPPNMSEDNLRNILTNSRQIQDRHRTGHPRKRFTIIHPDGNIEYTDKIETIAKQHPNFLLVKSNDVMKYLQGPHVFSMLQNTPTKENSSFQPSTINQLHRDVILNQENNRKAYVNSINQNVQKFSVSNNPSNSSTGKIINYPIDETLPVSIANPEIDVKNVNSKSTKYSIAASDISEKTSANTIVTENSLPIGREKFADTNQLLQHNLVTSTGTTITKNDLSPGSGTLANTTIISSHVPLDSNNAATITITEIDLPSDSGTSGNSTIAESNLPTKPFSNIAHTQNNLVLGPEKSNNITGINDNLLLEPEKSNKTNIENNKQSITKIADTITNAENNDYDSKNITKKYLLLNNSEMTKTEDALPIQLQNNTDDEITVLINKGQNAIVFDVLSVDSYVNKTTFNKENLTEISVPEATKENVNDTFKLEKYKESIHVNNSSNTQIVNSENATENSTFWFRENDQFWDKIFNGNESNNVFYFLFVPSVTNTKVETKTTIYPNGTTYEERIETTNDEDGVPIVSKQTKVTVKNCTNDILVE